MWLCSWSVPVMTSLPFVAFLFKGGDFRATACQGVLAAVLIHHLDWPLPQQPPPKIYKTHIENVWTT